MLLGLAAAGIEIRDFLESLDDKAPSNADVRLGQLHRISGVAEEDQFATQHMLGPPVAVRRRLHVEPGPRRVPIFLAGDAAGCCSEKFWGKAVLPQVGQGPERDRLDRLLGTICGREFGLALARKPN